MVDDDIQTVGLANKGQRTSESGCGLPVRVAVLCVIAKAYWAAICARRCQGMSASVRASHIYSHSQQDILLIVLVFACKLELITYFAIQATYATHDTVKTGIIIIVAVVFLQLVMTSTTVFNSIYLGLLSHGECY
jgi:hypothetical protein